MKWDLGTLQRCNGSPVAAAPEFILQLRDSLQCTVSCPPPVHPPPPNPQPAAIRQGISLLAWRH